jgi:diguanylate cyclase (GGDEF)-like protein
MSLRTETVRNGVYIELVRSLYATLPPTTIMSIGYVLSFSVMAFEAANSVLAAFALTGVLSSGMRIIVLMRGRADAAAPGLGVERARVVEKHFRIAYLQFAVLLGLSAAYVFTLEWAHFHMLTVCLLVGYGAGAAAGVGLRPAIAIPSMMVAIVPAVIVAALRWEPIYWVTAAMLGALLAGGSQSLLARRRIASTEIAKRLTFETLARRDELTALPNRLALREWFDNQVAIGTNQQLLAVHCLDLDNFKPVNDVFGHPVGDGLLKGIATRLTQALRPGDIAARVGGDEFVVIQADLRNPEDALALANRLRSAVAEPFSIKGHAISVATCIGYVVTRRASADLDELLGLADQALYIAKKTGAGVQYIEAPKEPPDRLAA